MRLNLFKLHDLELDSSLRQCLRAYTILPKFCKNPDDKNIKAKQIINCLRTIDKKLKHKNKDWRKKWVELIPYQIKKETLKDWFIGRASIPLIALEKLYYFNCKLELRKICNNLKYVSSSTKEPIRMPTELSADLIYLTGLILGDGSMPRTKIKGNNYDYKLQIISKHKKFLTKQIVPLFKKNFGIRRFDLRYRNAWMLTIRHKSVTRFFNKIVGLPFGNKSSIAEIPQIIKTLHPKKVIPFIAGLIDSDIGKHSKAIGCTFRSKKLVVELIDYFGKIGITAKHYGIHYKNEIYEQNDFTIPKSQIKRLKGLLTEVYLPKRKDRLKTIYELAGIP